MQRRLPLLLALAFAAPVVAGDAPALPPLESVVTLRVDGNIEIDANGKVVSHTLDTAVPEALQSIIDKAVATWTFAPPTEDGKPVERARSKMRVSLSAKDVEQGGAKGLAVKIDNVTFPPAQTEKRAPGDATLRPRDKLKHPGLSAEALVTLNFRYDPSGKIVDVAPSQCTILAVDKRLTPEEACEALERHSVQGFKRYHLKVEPGGKDELQPGTMAFMYASYGSRNARPETTGQWRPELRTPYRKAPWEPADAPRMGTSDVDDNGGGLASQTAGLTLLEGTGKTL